MYAARYRRIHRPDNALSSTMAAMLVSSGAAAAQLVQIVGRVGEGVVGNTEADLAVIVRLSSQMTASIATRESLN